jgi:hypothetical protein
MTEWKVYLTHCSCWVALDDESEFREVLRDNPFLCAVVIRSIFKIEHSYTVPNVRMVVVAISSDIVKFSCRSAKDLVPFMFGIFTQELCQIHY